jgi:TonB family protein
MNRCAFAARLLAPLLAVTALPASATSTQPPRPAADFPSLDSYYPPAAARAGQQGTATLHFCVDATGKLSEPPTLAGSSGNEVLDAAAIDLATAGSGHYTPPLEDGKPVRGCGNFRIAFKLRGGVGLPVSDPRFPTIGARIAKLDGEFTRRMQERVNELGHPLSLQAVLAPGGAAAERTIRQYARSFDSFIDETVGMTADFLDDVDYLEESPDIPESERRIFRAEWPNNRSALVVQFREMIGAIRDIVRVTDELGDYIAFSAPRRPSKSADEAQTPTEDPQLNAIRERARVAVEKLQNALKSMGSNPSTAPR